MQCGPISDVRRNISGRNIIQEKEPEERGPCRHRRPQGVQDLRQKNTNGVTVLHSCEAGITKQLYHDITRAGSQNDGEVRRVSWLVRRDSKGGLCTDKTFTAEQKNESNNRTTSCCNGTSPSSSALRSGLRDDTENSHGSLPALSSPSSHSYSEFCYECQ